MVTSDIVVYIDGLSMLVPREGRIGWLMVEASQAPAISFLADRLLA